MTMTATVRYAKDGDLIPQWHMQMGLLEGNADYRKSSEQDLKVRF